jgi:hypothetical protein
MFLVAHPYSSYPTAPVSSYNQVFSRNIHATHLDHQYPDYALAFDEDYEVIEQVAARRFMQARRNEVARHRAMAAARIMQQRRAHEYQVAVRAAEEEAHRVHVARARAQEVAKSQYLEQLRREEVQRTLHAREMNTCDQYYCPHHHDVSTCSHHSVLYP